jgi:hypothetical protein
MLDDVDWQYFEHLDEGDRKIEVCLVGADKGETKENADGDNGVEVRSSVHRDGLEAIKEICRPGEDLSHYRGKNEMPCRQEDRETCKS